MTERQREQLAKLKDLERAEKNGKAQMQRQFRDFCKRKFGKTPTEIADILQAQNGSDPSNAKLVSFAERIATFYGLQNDDDFQKWIDVMLNDGSARYWKSRR